MLMGAWLMEVRGWLVEVHGWLVDVGGGAWVGGGDGGWLPRVRRPWGCGVAEGGQFKLEVRCGCLLSPLNSSHKLITD